MLIVGDGPCRAELEKTAEALGVRDGLIFTGMVSPGLLCRRRYFRQRVAKRNAGAHLYGSDVFGAACSVQGG